MALFNLQKKYNQHMTYLLLPSARVAIYEAVAKKVKVLPIKAEQIVTLGLNNQQNIVLSYQKSISIYNSHYLKTSLPNASLQPLASSVFNKKLEGLTHNSKDSIFVSDKFGDIYSVDLNGQTKYLNSNLGIPTFLQYLKVNNKSYIIVGDEDTRIKIYNQQRMHQIKAFWFITKRVPIQLKQASQGKLLLLLKKQQNNFNNNEQAKQNFVEVYEFSTQHIEATQFQGKLLYVSQQVEQSEQCKYQTLVTHLNSKAYLLKLFSKRINIVTFAFTNNHYQLQSTKSLQIVEGQWDSIYASVVLQQQAQEMVIVYGKSQQLQDLEINTQIYEKDMLSFQHSWRCSINQAEHLIVHKL